MVRENQLAVEKKVHVSWYLAFYGEMLTENQREIAQLYYEEDYSLTEIAQQYSVSRQSIHDTISRVEKTLTDLENKLGLAKRFQALEDGLKKCRDELAQISLSDDNRQHLQNARMIVNNLLAQEDM